MIKVKSERAWEMKKKEFLIFEYQCLVTVMM